MSIQKDNLILAFDDLRNDLFDILVNNPELYNRDITIIRKATTVINKHRDKLITTLENEK